MVRRSYVVTEGANHALAYEAPEHIAERYGVKFLGTRYNTRRARGTLFYGSEENMARLESEEGLTPERWDSERVESIARRIDFWYSWSVGITGTLITGLFDQIDIQLTDDPEDGHRVKVIDCRVEVADYTGPKAEEVYELVEQWFERERARREFQNTGIMALLREPTA